MDTMYQGERRLPRKKEALSACRPVRQAINIKTRKQPPTMELIKSGLIFFSQRKGFQVFQPNSFLSPNRRSPKSFACMPYYLECDFFEAFFFYYLCSSLNALTWS
eukprot:TRINITY_DN43979_c0_g1_i1.p1 TRINITY_DN43979_c0_g1~~TRINITY_DN43979_c0_g1_i1.p1  ORF type:complete len:105 (+),score=4.45 TRINITY_DN43979_c0_g1_i1:112-426(+)